MYIVEFPQLSKGGGFNYIKENLETCGEKNTRKDKSS